MKDLIVQHHTPDHIAGLVPEPVNITSPALQATSRRGLTVDELAVRPAFEHLDVISVDHLHQHLGFREPLQYPVEWRNRPVKDWTMESDGFVLRYLFRNFRPNRHLEFGTWEGDGVIRCVEECDATVWTLNLLEGECKAGGEWTYATDDPSLAGKSANAERLVTNHGTWVRTDAYGMIGHKYLERGLGHRVCQIYADSRRWDTAHYPDGFFDSIFVDGGHAPDVVRADTKHSLRLLRRGGLLIWHDFCPLEAAADISPAARDVAEYIAAEQHVLRRRFSPLMWIAPSWLLIGIKTE
jgi:hypothetical protein